MKSLSIATLTLGLVPLALNLEGQINSISSSLSLQLVYQGAFYDDGPSFNANNDIEEFFLSEPYQTTTGDTSYGLTINRTPADFSEYDHTVNPGDKFTFDLSADASAGPGETQYSSIMDEVYFSGYLYGDAESYSKMTLVFDYYWTWNSTYTEHSDPAGNSVGSLLLGYELIGDSFTEIEDPNYVEIDGLSDSDVAYNIGIGGDLANGEPYQLNFSDTGQIQFEFYLDENYGDSYFDLYFYNELEAYAAMDEGISLIPEASSLSFILGALIPYFLIRRRCR